MKTIVVIFSVLIALSSMNAFATSQHLKAFKRAYPDSKALHSCGVCHEDVPQLNYYGIDFEKAGFDFKLIENLDSDGDGALNLREIQSSSFPGDKSSVPASTPVEGQ